MVCCHVGADHPVFIGNTVHLGCLTIPLVLFHINTAVRLECDTLVFEQYTLFDPAGRRASCVINNTVTRIFAVNLGSTQYSSDEPRVFVVTG